MRSWAALVRAGWRHWQIPSASGCGRASDNGARLLDLAASFHLWAANIFFKHHRAHLATWQHVTTKRWYVKDYILVSGSTMRGVRDCRIFRSVHHGPSDHCLLGVSLQLHLRALKRDAPTCQGLWEGGGFAGSGPLCWLWAGVRQSVCYAFSSGVRA